MPIDFSKTSLRALDVAVPLARDHAARLFLLAAIEPSAYPVGMEGAVVVAPGAELEKDARNGLEKIARRLLPASMKTTQLVEHGRAPTVITQVAKAKAIDLIVLTTHGRTGLDRVLMGSTAEQVVRHAHCPVYIVRPVRRAGTRSKKD